MNAVGLVVEYNPFHNGHAFHLEQAKKITGADIVIVAMSGNFLQRGEPALVSKWKRTEMALSSGADIVFELPYVFATQKAETFANGAVSILEAAGCQSLCFGSESGHINSFQQTLTHLENNKEQYNNRVKFHLNKGNSYPKAASLAFLELSSSNDFIDLSKPNNILGYHYLKAAHDQHASINICTVTRKSADYHDQHFTSESIASATSIRKALFSADGQISSIRQYVPSSTYSNLLKYKEKYGLYHHWEQYWPYLKFRFMQITAEQLNTIYEVEEGLENRILPIALQAESYQQFMEKLKTKRYTWTRLQRACVHILTNSTKEEMYMETEKAEYLRLLGMTMKGKAYLNKNKGNLGLPLISRISARHNKQLTLDIRASRVYALAVSGKEQKTLLEKEFKQPPILIE